MDISVALMMSTCKYISFAWCYHDGGKRTEQLSEDQRKRRIEKLPNFLEYFSYIFFFPSVTTGPTFDYIEFRDFIRQSGDFANIPSPIKELSKLLLRALVFMFVSAKILPMFPLRYLISEE